MGLIGCFYRLFQGRKPPLEQSVSAMRLEKIGRVKIDCETVEFPADLLASCANILYAVIPIGCDAASVAHLFRC